MHEPAQLLCKSIFLISMISKSVLFFLFSILFHRVHAYNHYLCSFWILYHFLLSASSLYCTRYSFSSYLKSYVWLLLINSTRANKWNDEKKKNKLREKKNAKLLFKNSKREIKTKQKKKKKTMTTEVDEWRYMASEPPLLSNHILQ